MIRVEEPPFDPESELKTFAEMHDDFGAVASFTGYVRGERGAVTTLELKHYPGFTESEIAKIEQQARHRFDIKGTLIIHRYGKLCPGDPIVMVAAISDHRKPALEAVDFLMDYLKTDAPFWKRETSPTGNSKWIEPRATDHSAKRAWQDMES